MTSAQETWRAQAEQLKADGYTGAVTARKMIQVHGMPERAARHLVSSVYGTPVDPRAGDTLTEIAIGVGIIAAAAAGALLYWLIEVDDGDGDGLMVLAVAVLSVSGAGVWKIFSAVVNRNANEPLDDPELAQKESIDEREGSRDFDDD